MGSSGEQLSSMSGSLRSKSSVPGLAMLIVYIAPTHRRTANEQAPLDLRPLIIAIPVLPKSSIFAIWMVVDLRIVMICRSR
jgi:hypothetical protein